jgi:hypothetical protein
LLLVDGDLRDAREVVQPQGGDVFGGQLQAGGLVGGALPQDAGLAVVLR